LDSVLDDSDEIQPIYLIDIRCVDFEDQKRFIIMSGSSKTGHTRVNSNISNFW